MGFGPGFMMGLGAGAGAGFFLKRRGRLCFVRRFGGITAR